MPLSKRLVNRIPACSVTIYLIFTCWNAQSAVVVRCTLGAIGMLCGGYIVVRFVAATSPFLDEQCNGSPLPNTVTACVDYSIIQKKRSTCGVIWTPRDPWWVYFLFLFSKLSFFVYHV